MWVCATLFPIDLCVTRLTPKVLVFEGQQGSESWKYDYKVAGMSEEAIAELGDESPRFIYTI